MEHYIWKAGFELTQKVVPFCVCTIIGATGSVPRRTGASMIVQHDGITIGTIGGGILERLSAEEALLAIQERKTRLRTFSLDDPHAIDTGAVCGGTVTVFFNAQVPARVAHVFGAGHVALPTVGLLARIGYAVKLYDESAEFANRDRFPDVVDFYIGDFSTLAANAEIKSEDSVVILTASHETDYQVLRTFRGRLPFYLGVIGSKAKAQHYRQRLTEENWSAEELERIHSPIGLMIGSRTPEEIAVSIAAQMISLRGSSE